MDTTTRIVECDQVTLHPPGGSQDYDEVLTLEQQQPLEQDTEIDRHKHAKPRKLVAVEVLGYEIGRGLKKRVIPPEDIYKLAAIGCSDAEIARWYNVNVDTLRYNFHDIIEKGREDMKHSLRRAMLKNALGGNAVMQIFMAKNFLGMSDSPANSDENKPLPWNDE